MSTHHHGIGGTCSVGELAETAPGSDPSSASPIRLEYGTSLVTNTPRQAYRHRGERATHVANAPHISNRKSPVNSPVRGALGQNPTRSRPPQSDPLGAWLTSSCAASYSLQPSPGMLRFMEPSKKGTVKAVSPWLGLHTIPLAMRLALVGASDVTFRPKMSATSPERWGPAPSSAMARRYRFSAGVSLSKRTRKKLSSSAA